MRYQDHPIELRVPVIGPARWPKRVKARRRFHRAFFAWHAANGGRFAIPLELVERRDTRLTLGFHGIIRALTAILTVDEINVSFDWDGVWWDTLVWPETYPKRVPGGWVCDQCDPATRSVFPSREALWADEVFEEFLRWVNEELATARVLVISGGLWVDSCSFGAMTNKP